MTKHSWLFVCVVLAGCSSAYWPEAQDMTIVVRFTDDPKVMYNWCGEHAEACTVVSEGFCQVYLPKAADGSAKHVEHELSHCFGRTDVPSSSFRY